MLITDHLVSISDILTTSNMIVLSLHMFSGRLMKGMGGGGEGKGDERSFKINLDVCMYVYIHPPDSAAVNIN